jgi:hypothetical protein
LAIFFSHIRCASTVAIILIAAAVIVMSLSAYGETIHGVTTIHEVAVVVGKHGIG